jgi:chemotaxis protein CheX
MKAEYINPFLVAAITAFDTMLGCKLTRGTPYVKHGPQPEHEVSGVIGLSGKARGTVVLSLSREAALNATAVLLEERPTEINADVTDAVGELTNIIAGSAKAKLDHLELSVSLPTVITGKWHCVEFPKKVTPICIPFESKWGRITVEVGLIEGPACGE